MNFRIRCLCAALIAWSIQPWASTMAQPSAAAEPDTLRSALLQLQSSAAVIPVAVRRHRLDSARAQLEQLYQQDPSALLWSHAGVATLQARALLGAMATSADDALVPDDYDVKALTQQLKLLSPQTAAQFDVGLSLAAWGFVMDLHQGRIDARSVGFELPQRHDLDAGATLRQLSSGDTGSILAALEPQFVHYRLLKQALLRYRLLAQDAQLTQWQQLPPMHSAKLGLGQSYAGAPALRHLLRALNGVPLAGANAVPAPPAGVAPVAGAADVDSTTLDSALVLELKRFQALHGLEADGQLGRTTYAALTLPLSQRVRQIELTLERWRWLPPIAAPAILVNIPAFRLFALGNDVDREADMLRMDVIVGKDFQDTQTPVFAAIMRTVVFRPFWDVPRSILLKEMLPKIRRNLRYLQAEQLEIVRGEGDDAKPVAPSAAAIAGLASGALRIRQLPGPRNSLGLIKFLFPNSHNVYMHSTPALQLFQQSRRAFSHGCIRLSDPISLAEFVLKNTPGDWTHDRVAATMNGTKQLRVTLATPVNVFILYATAMASEDGAMHFYDDLYGHDRQLEQLLQRASR